MPETQKMLVCVADIVYNVDEDRHSVSFSRKAKNFNAYKFDTVEKNIQEYQRQFKALLVNSWTEADDKIARMVGKRLKDEVLKGYGDMLQPKDFSIRWYYALFDEEDAMWVSFAFCGNIVKPIFD